MTLWKRYGYPWITAVLFLASLAGHWTLGWLPMSISKASTGRFPGREVGPKL